MSKVGIGTFKNGFRAPDLLPEGLNLSTRTRERPRKWNRQKTLKMSKVGIGTIQFKKPIGNVGKVFGRSHFGPSSCTSLENSFVADFCEKAGQYPREKVQDR